jgi:DNA-binding MarR family transcriptional regulator
MTQQGNIFSFQNPDESPGYLLWQISNLWQRKMNQALDTLDLTHVQFVLLAALYWLSMSNKSVTQIDIAEHAKVDKMVTSNVLRTLQKKGLLTRAEHETDTRAKSVVMTEAGKKLLTEAIKLVEQIDEEFFSKLGKKQDAFAKDMLTLMK